MCVCVEAVMGRRKSDHVCVVCVWRGVMGRRKSDHMCVCVEGGDGQEEV